MSRHVVRQMVPLFHSRLQILRAQLRPLSSASELPSPDAIHMTENCVRRLKELHATESSNKGKMLRLGVETGGCSGFQYVFCLDDKKNSDDRFFEKDGFKLVVDNVSYDFVKGATVDYVDELIRSAFQDPIRRVGRINKTGLVIQINQKTQMEDARVQWIQKVE